MKTFLIALLSLLSMELVAAPHPRPRRHPHPHHRSGTYRLHKVPWQTIVAGGAAVSGIVFAYKVGNGIEQGTIESAKAAPEAFIEKSNGFGSTLRIAGGVTVLIAIVYIWKNFRDSSKPSREERAKRK